MKFYSSDCIDLKAAAAVIAILIAGLATSGAARAACTDVKMPVRPATLALPAGSAHFSNTMYHPGQGEARSIPVGDFDDRAPIVGLWQFKATGIAADYGTQAWHADGTELIYSMAPNPATGDVCQGVWRRVGRHTYSVNHIAMGWAAPGVDPKTGAQFIRVHLHYLITLGESGNTFTGTYTAAVYLEVASDPFNEDPTNPPIASGGGAITATRVQPDDAS